ncbi:hypothetical protein PCAR4_350123 [Paraburkholderia caribensis]|jgi:hypothetical protein|nr:hypothetical protein PCAR4_350123 [Paraburkholderia caribensis]
MVSLDAKIVMVARAAPGIGATLSQALSAIGARAIDVPNWRLLTSQREPDRRSNLSQGQRLLWPKCVH